MRGEETGGADQSCFDLSHAVHAERVFSVAEILASLCVPGSMSSHNLSESVCLGGMRGWVVWMWGGERESKMPTLQYRPQLCGGCLNGECTHHCPRVDAAA